MDKNENQTGLDYSEEVTSFVSTIRQNLQGPGMGERSRKETEKEGPRNGSCWGSGKRVAAETSL